MICLGEGRVCLGNQWWEETMHINCKMNFIQKSPQRFSLHFKSIFLRVYCIAQKMYISQELAKLVCAFSSKTLHAMDKTRPSKCKFPDLRLFA